MLSAAAFNDDGASPPFYLNNFARRIPIHLEDFEISIAAQVRFPRLPE